MLLCSPLTFTIRVLQNIFCVLQKQFSHTNLERREKMTNGFSFCLRSYLGHCFQSKHRMRCISTHLTSALLAYISYWDDGYRGTVWIKTWREPQRNVRKGETGHCYTSRTRPNGSLGSHLNQRKTLNWHYTPVRAILVKVRISGKTLSFTNPNLRCRYHTKCTLFQSPGLVWKNKTWRDVSIIQRLPAVIQYSATFGGFAEVCQEVTVGAEGRLLNWAGCPSQDECMKESRMKVACSLKLWELSLVSNPPCCYFWGIAEPLDSAKETHKESASACEPIFKCSAECVHACVHLKSVGDVTAHLECHGYTLADPQDSRRVKQPALIICLAVSVMTARRTPCLELWLAQKSHRLIGALIREGLPPWCRGPRKPLPEFIFLLLLRKRGKRERRPGRKGLFVDADTDGIVYNLAQTWLPVSDLL